MDYIGTRVLSWHGNMTRLSSSISPPSEMFYSFLIHSWCWCWCDHLRQENQPINKERKTLIESLRTKRPSSELCPIMNILITNMEVNLFIHIWRQQTCIAKIDMRTICFKVHGPRQSWILCPMSLLLIPYLGIRGNINSNLEVNLSIYM